MQFLAAALAFLRRQTHLTLMIGLLCMICGALFVVLTAGDLPVPAASSTSRSGPSKPIAGAHDPKADNTSTEAAEASTPPATPGTATAPQPVPVTPVKELRLVVSPASFTVKAGETYKGFTVQTGDGKAINMPFLISPTAPDIFFNFPAGPAKTSWKGDILTQSTKPAGTYTFDVIAQTDKAVRYKSSFTITIIPSGFMTLTVTSLGYDAENDAVIYSIEAVRHNGYNQTIDRVTAVSPTSQNLECATEQVTVDLYALACGVTSGSRPAGGTIFINAFMTNNEVVSGSTTFTLPSL